jgi:hypothetical protein
MTFSHVFIFQNEQTWHSVPPKSHTKNAKEGNDTPVKLSLHQSTFPMTAFDEAIALSIYLSDENNQDETNRLGDCWVTSIIIFGDIFDSFSMTSGGVRLQVVALEALTHLPLRCEQTIVEVGCSHPTRLCVLTFTGGWFRGNCGWNDQQHINRSDLRIHETMTPGRTELTFTICLIITRTTISRNKCLG